MKFIAKEIHLCPLMLGEEVLLTQQIKAIYAYYLQGLVYEIHHVGASSEVVLKIECLTRGEAEQALSKLPLVRAGKSTFDMYEIRPYAAFKELIK